MVSFVFYVEMTIIFAALRTEFALSKGVFLRDIN